MSDKKSQLDFINEELDTLDGFEQINMDTMAVPFVKILQTLSPQLNKKKPEYIENANEGEWFNNVEKNVYGSEIDVIVLKFDHVFVEWLPKRAGFKGYHSPANADKLAEDKTFGAWKMSNGNELQETYIYYCLVVGHENAGIVVITFSSSGLKLAREWNRIMTTHIMDNGKRAKPYYMVWKLGSSYHENDKGSWYLPKISMSGYISPEQYAIIQPERLALPDKHVDYAQITDDTSNSPKQIKEIKDEDVAF